MAELPWPEARYTLPGSFFPQPAEALRSLFRKYGYETAEEDGIITVISTEAAETLERSILRILCTTAAKYQQTKTTIKPV